jgi:hypothetical protein
MLKLQFNVVLVITVTELRGLQIAREIGSKNQLQLSFYRFVLFLKYMCGDYPGSILVYYGIK